MATDVLSELLIAQLLEEDMRLLNNQQQAEALQLTQAIADSVRGQNRIPKRPAREPTPDVDIAIRIMAEEARLSGDAALAQSLQHSDDAGATTNRQFAMRLAASEKKSMLDAEFARRLQEADDDVDMDAPNMSNAESVLGQHVIDQILADDPNNKGKGREAGRRAFLSEDTLQAKTINTGEEKVRIKQEDEEMSERQPPICGICMDPFQTTWSPIAAAKSANSSSRLPFGLRMPCAGSHSFCMDCIGKYIKSKLDPNGDGSGNPNALVFPIPCPSCPLDAWADGISDSVASRVLGEKDLILWHTQRLLDSLPKVYCPNPKCSALVQVHDDDNEPQASCPLCNVLICVPCRVLWHADITCEVYQALPLDERSPEDQQALQLAKAKNWRRCPSCSVIVELAMGCNHITCRCGTHFCFKCGSLWDIKNTRCTRKPSCELWDERMLLEEREREREPRDPPQPAPPAVYRAPPPPYVPAPAPIPQRINPAIDYGDLDWMSDRDILWSRHPFTTNMIASLTCLYCDAKLTSLADLQYHLSHTRRHGLYTCCGRFFKRETDLINHIDAVSRKGVRHIHMHRRE